MWPLALEKAVAELSVYFGETDPGWLSHYKQMLSSACPLSVLSAVVLSTHVGAHTHKLQDWDTTQTAKVETSMACGSVGSAGFHLVLL